MKRNPGMRFISKLCFEFVVGKFDQNPKVKHLEYIDNEKDFYRVILNDKIEHISLSFSMTIWFMLATKQRMNF